MSKVLSIAACAIFAVAVSGCHMPSKFVNHNSPSATTVAYNPKAEHNTGGATLLNDGTFDAEITNCQCVAVVDFFAKWCGPCKKMLPVIDAMAAEVSEAKIAKVDVDASEETASKFEVHAMPCFVVFKDGKEVERHYGVHSKDEILGWIQTYAEKSVSLAR